MTSIWNWLQDTSIAGKYSLGEVLGESEDGAFFRTAFGPEQQTAALKLVPETSPTAGEEQLELWRIAAGISHPNIVRLLDYGRTDVEGHAFLYAVLEFPDDSLEGAVERGPLTVEETREVLKAALDGLHFIHSQGLVHGAVDASHVVAVGNQIKLSADTLRLPSRHATTSEDVRALGALVYQLISGRALNPGATLDLTFIPEPFRTVIEHSLAHDPNQRWSLMEIAAALSQPPKPAVRPEAPAKQTQTRAVPSRPFPRWIFVATPVFLLALILLFREIKPKPEAPAPPPAPVIQAPAPKPAPTRNWRVVAYTYSQRAEAEKRAESINRKWSAAQAEVLPTGTTKPGYLVAVGGPLNREEALRFLKLARSRGMPRSTYVRGKTP